MSADVDTTIPVAPLVPPVTVSPTVKSPIGTVTTKTVADVTVLIVVLSPLVPPVIVSLAAKVPVTLLTVKLTLLDVRLSGL